MPKFDVEVEGATYEVDAPDDRTAWAWANQIHQKEKAAVSGDVAKMLNQGVIGRAGTGAKASLQNAMYGIKDIVTDLSPEEQRTILANKQFFEDKENTAGKFGGFVADVASFALPGGIAAKGITKGLTMLPRAARGATALGANAAVDAGLSAAYSTEDKGDAAVSGALGSVGGQLLGRALARTAGGIVRPSAQAQKLMAEGVQPTIGQGADQGTMFGRRVAKLEEAAQSLPVMGDVITNARGRAQRELVQVAANRAVPPGGVVQDASREGINELAKQFKQAYGVIDQYIFKPDQQFEQDILTVVTNPNYQASKETIDRVLSFVDQNYTKKFQQGPQGVGAFLSGEGFKNLDSEIGRRIRDLAGQQGTEALAERRILTAIEGALGQYRNRNLPPDVVRELADTDRAYAAYKRLARAGKYSNEGDITPAQLNRAVKAMSQGDTYARGQAFMQDLTDAGSILRNRVPNSGTFDRAAEAGLLMQAARNPYGTALGVGSAVTLGVPAYSRPAQRFMLGGYSYQKALEEALRRQAWLAGSAGAAAASE
jgi:hypothetical protein